MKRRAPTCDKTGAQSEATARGRGARSPESPTEPDPQVDRAGEKPEPRLRDKGGLWMDPDEAERVDREFERQRRGR